MSESHFHLILNHLPVSGALFACVLMVCGRALRNETVLNVALFTLMAIGISAIPVYFTGMLVEDAVRNILDKALIRTHSLAGELAMYASALCGIAAYITYTLRTEQKPSAKKATVLLFVLSFLTLALMVWAGWTGGMINHG